MKYIKYISILVVSALVSCIDGPLESLPGGQSSASSDKIELVARILPFDERDVATRAEPDNFTYEESKVTMMDFIIFNSAGTCVFYGHLDGENLTMTLDRSVAFADMDQDLLNSCDIYTVANFPENYNGVVYMAQQAGITVEDYIATNVVGEVTEDFFNQYSTNVTGINIPTHGLPMVGKAEGVDLSEDAVYAAGHMITVETKILYSKMVFNINVVPDQVIPDIEGNLFKISKYEVYKLARKVDVTGGTESAAGSNDGTTDSTPVYTDSIVGTLPASLTNYYLTDLSFTFYLPERFVAPQTSASSYPYPFRQNDETKTIRDEDKNLRQRFKPKLVEGQTHPATFVRIYGTFLNHQGHAYDLIYDIYVGNDNYGNFDIVRSRQYNNNLTIRGIQNNNDQPLVGDVSIDHRVDVKRTLPITIGLRRETLLDAHWEVRPLRVRANVDSPSYVENSACKVEITYLNGEDPWIGLEPSYGDGSTVNSELYCAGANSSAGKRKYFTTDLVTNTLNRESDIGTDGFSNTGGQSVVVPVSETSNDCVWVYVDECTEASQDINAKRSAKITLTYGLIDGGTFKGFNDYTDEEILAMIDSERLPQNFVRVDPVEYTFMQHLLYEVVYNGQTYHIEHEEEYLHNFDTEDGFELNPTQDNGMAWGLDGAQLSFDNESLLFATSEGGGIISAVENIVRNWVKSNLELNGIYYDFYIPKHDTGVDEKATKRDYRGWVFCNEIIADINGTRDTGFEGTIGSLALDEQPSSAIEYCLNKNKQGASVEWYLPAIDEIEDIMTSEYGAFDGVFQNNLYWSSQPAYKKNYCYKEAAFLVVGARAEYYLDDPSRARATKIERKWSDEDKAYIYDNVPSGTIDYVDGLEITGWAGSYEGVLVAPGTTLGGKNIVGKIIPEAGNRARTDKARVRCVRKNSNTNTSATE